MAAERAAGAGAPLAVAVVDRFGKEVVLERADGAMLAALHTLPAATAVRLGRETTSFAMSADVSAAETVSRCRAAGLVASAGAVPLFAGALIDGGVGASGGRAVEDARASAAAAAVWSSGRARA